MKKALSGIIITLAISVAVLCMAVIMAACNDKDGNDKDTDKYTVLVVYENGTPVNGLTDGIGGVNAETGDSDTKILIQICSYDPDTLAEGHCTKTLELGADGKVVFDDSQFDEIEDGYEWHIKIAASSLPSTYTYDMVAIDGYGTYTITLKAAN